MKNFVVILVSLFVFTSCQVASGQTEKVNKETPVVVTDFSEFYRLGILRSDYKQADVVAYVDIKERVLANSIGGGDCENDKGAGYCLYRLKAEIKEVYKGKITEKTIEFYTSTETGYPKKYLMGEKVVFLNWFKNDETKERNLEAIENSTRSIEHDILEKMRKIAKQRN